MAVQIIVQAQAVVKGKKKTGEWSSWTSSRAQAMMSSAEDSGASLETFCIGKRLHQTHGLRQALSLDCSVQEKVGEGWLLFLGTPTAPLPPPPPLLMASG